MELWIRSQENYEADITPRLIKVNNLALDYEEENDSYYIVVNEGIEIAYYDSEKRALEVLDEIQKLLMPTYLISNISKEDGLKLQDQIAFGTSIIQTREDSKLEQINGSIVYKMPKE